MSTWRLHDFYADRTIIMANQKAKITKTLIKSFPVPLNGQSYLRDTELKGFAVRTLPSGVKSFVFERRIGGKVKRITIGKTSDLPVEQARKQAEKLAGEIAIGLDPAQQRAEARAKSLSLNDILNNYLADNKQLKPRTIKDYQDVIGLYLDDWLKRPLSEIKEDDVVKKFKGIAESTPSRANLTFRYFGALWNYAAHC